MEKTELQFYVELIEEKLEGLSPYFPFSLAYAARTPRIGTFIELMFQDQGFNVVSIDCASLYPAEDSDSDENTNNINTHNTNENSESPDYLSQALDNLRAQCSGVEKPIIMFQNVEVLKRSERYDNQMVSLLTEGMKLNDEQYIPVILTSTRSISSSYTNHVNQTLNFKYHMIDNNKRVKKICGKKEDDELLAALLENGQNPYEKKSNLDSLTPEQESSKESTYQKMAELSKKYHIGMIGITKAEDTIKSALMKDIKIDVEQDFSHMKIPDSIKKMKSMPTLSSNVDGKNVENKKMIPDLGLNFLYPSSPIDADIHPPVKSEKNKNDSPILAGSIKSHKSQGGDWQSVVIQKIKDKNLNHSFSIADVAIDFEADGLGGTFKPGLNKDVEANILKLKDVFLNGGKNSKNIAENTSDNSNGNSNSDSNINQDNPNYKQKP